MVKHIVLWQLMERANGRSKEENAAIIKERLEALVGVIPGLLKLEVGYTIGRDRFNLALCSEFTDKEALAGYDVHPAHQEVRQYVKSCVADRATVDYEI